MVPKSRAVASVRSRSKPGVIASIYQELKSPENASIVRSVVVFAAAVTFFQSSWGEYLAPS
ncbi:hypothetical protein RUND412_005305 [Rhizina undulata]